MKGTLRRASGGVRDVDTLAKLQVGTECMLNLPGNIEDLEGFRRFQMDVPYSRKTVLSGS